MTDEWANELISILQRSSVDINGEEYPIVKAVIWEQYHGGEKRLEIVCQHKFGFATITDRIDQYSSVVSIVEGVLYSLSNFITSILDQPEGYRNMIIQQPENEKEPWQIEHEKYYGNQ